jgi:hypothetical protein
VLIGSQGRLFYSLIRHPSVKLWHLSLVVKLKTALLCTEDLGQSFMITSQFPIIRILCSCVAPDTTLSYCFSTSPVHRVLSISLHNTSYQVVTTSGCVCVHTCLHIYMCIHVFAYVCVYVYTRVGIYVCIHVFAYLCVYTFLHICVCIGTHVFAHIYVYVFIHVFEYIRVCVYTCLHICVCMRVYVLAWMNEWMNEWMNQSISACMCVFMCVWVNE